MGQGFRTDHVQSTKGRGSRKILGARSEMGWRAKRLILTTLGSSAIGSEDREDPFLRGLEPRVVATAGRGVKEPGALGQVPTPPWASGFSQETGGRCLSGILYGAISGPVCGPRTVNPGTSRLPWRPHLTTLGARRFLACSSAPVRLKPPLRPGRGRGPTTRLGTRPRPLQTPALSEGPAPLSSARVGGRHRLGASRHV